MEKINTLNRLQNPKWKERKKYIHSNPITWAKVEKKTVQEKEKSKQQHSNNNIVIEIQTMDVYL